MSGIRFSGLASGMDTENMVKELMKAERYKVDKYEQKKTLFEWKTSAYTDMNKSIASFVVESRKSLGIDVDYFGKITSSSVNKMDWVKSTSSSDSSIAEISSNTEALDGTNSINITKLASGVFAGNKNDITGITDIADIKGKTLTVNGEDFTLKADATDAEEILQDLASQINANDNIKGDIVATYDENNKKFFISTKGTGVDSEISFESTNADVRDFLANDLGIAYTVGSTTTDISFTTKDDNPADGTTEYFATKSGQDLELTFNGISMTNDKNEMTINNITINAKATGSVTATTSTDTDAVIDKVNEFVENYNVFIDVVNGKLNEKQNRSYQPLSAEQKEAMKEDDIKLWEEKAKSGLLRNDDYLSSMLSRTRSWIYAEVEGVDDKYNQIAEIGITTTSNYKDNGKLEVDEDKLRAALQDDPTAVMDMLFKSATDSKFNKKESEMDSEILKEKRENTGFFGRIYDEFAAGMQGMIEKAGTSGNDSLYRKVKSNILMDFVTSGSQSIIGKQLSTLNKSIDDENARLLSVENRYWSQFGAMEKAINEMNQQSGWLGQQMGM